MKNEEIAKILTSRKVNVKIFETIKREEFEPGRKVIVTAYSTSFKTRLEQVLKNHALEWDINLRCVSVTLERKGNQPINESNLPSYIVQFPSTFSDEAVKLWFYKIVGEDKKFDDAVAEILNPNFENILDLPDYIFDNADNTDNTDFNATPDTGNTTDLNAIDDTTTYNDKTYRKDTSVSQPIVTGTIDVSSKAIVKFKSQIHNWDHYAIGRIKELSFENHLHSLEIKPANEPNSYKLTFPSTIANQKEFWLHIINKQYQTAFEILAQQPCYTTPPTPSNNLQLFNQLDLQIEYADQVHFTSVGNYFTQASSLSDIEERLKIMLSSEMSPSTKCWHLLNVLHMLSGINYLYSDFFMHATITQLRKPNHILILHALFNTALPAQHRFFSVHAFLKKEFSTHFAIIDWHVDCSKKYAVQFWTHCDASSLVNEWRKKSICKKVTISSQENGRFHQFKFSVTSDIEYNKFDYFQQITNPFKQSENNLAPAVSNNSNNNNNTAAFIEHNEQTNFLHERPITEDEEAPAKRLKRDSLIDLFSIFPNQPSSETEAPITEDQYLPRNDS